MNRNHLNQWLMLPLLVLLIVATVYGASGVAALSLAPSPASATPITTTVIPPVGEPLEEDAAARALETRIIDIYEATSPSVVNITNRSYVTYRFMGTVPEEGSCSGFVYDTAGHIVTNHHVIEGADELLVTLADGQVFPGTVVGSDSLNDLAVISIDAGDALPEPLALGESDSLRVGQFVLAIGNPFGIGQTLTTGVISALERIIESPDDAGFIGEAIQTDAAINPGNSGGPMLDLQGRVVGVNSQIISPSGASAGIGFAVSATTVRRVVPQLIEEGYYAHPWLGTNMLGLTPSIAQVLREAGADVPTDTGLLVVETYSGGPAAKAGVRGGSQRLRIGRYQLLVGGDIIQAIDREPIADMQELTIYLETRTTIGDAVQLAVLRDGKELVVPLKLGEQPQS